MLYTMSLIKGTIKAIHQNGRVVEMVITISYPSKTTDAYVQAWDDVGEKILKTIRTGQYVIAAVRYFSKPTADGEVRAFKLDDASDIGIIMTADPPLTSIEVDEPQRPTQSKPTRPTRVKTTTTPPTKPPTKSASGLPKMTSPRKTPGVILTPESDDEENTTNPAVRPAAKPAARPAPKATAKPATDHDPLDKPVHAHDDEDVKIIDDLDAFIDAVIEPDPEIEPDTDHANEPDPDRPDDDDDSLFEDD